MRCRWTLRPTLTTGRSRWKIPLEDHVLDGLLTPAQICGSLPDVEQGRQDIGATQAREFHPEQGSNQLLE
jgi:hypothetical protein